MSFLIGAAGGDVLIVLVKLLGGTGNLEHLGKDVLESMARSLYDKKIKSDRVITAMADAMEKKGDTVQKRGLDWVISDVTFRTHKKLWKSGDVSDIWRDTQKKKVIMLVKEAGITAESNINDIIKATMQAVIDLTL